MRCSERQYKGEVLSTVAASSSLPIAFPPLVLKLDDSRFTGGEIAERQPPNPDLPKWRRRIVRSA